MFLAFYTFYFTGATGGVGSIATLLLSQLGFHTIALTGKKETSEEYLKRLGAKEVRSRSELENEPKALSKETFAGCVDNVGGKVLANILSMIKYGGTVAACGLAGGLGLPTTVAPFILRGVTLAGVESALVTMERRTAIYEKYSEILTKDDNLSLVCGEDRVLSLEEVPAIADRILKGDIQGRYVVKPN